MAMVVGQLWFMNFANSCLWARSWNKLCDSPAACAFPSVDRSSYCLLQRNALLPTLPSPCLPGETHYGSTLSRKPHGLAWVIYSFLNLSQVINYTFKKGKWKTILRNLWKYHTQGIILVHVNDNLNMWNPSGQGPYIVLDFIVQSYSIFKAHEMGFSCLVECFEHLHGQNLIWCQTA